MPTFPHLIAVLVSQTRSIQLQHRAIDCRREGRGQAYGQAFQRPLRTPARRQDHTDRLGVLSCLQVALEVYAAASPKLTPLALEALLQHTHLVRENAYRVLRWHEPQRNGRAATEGRPGDPLVGQHANGEGDREEEKPKDHSRNSTRTTCTEEGMQNRTTTKKTNVFEHVRIQHVNKYESALCMHTKHFPFSASKLEITQYLY